MGEGNRVDPALAIRGNRRGGAVRDGVPDRRPPCRDRAFPRRGEVDQASRPPGRHRRSGRRHSRRAGTPRRFGDRPGPPPREDRFDSTSPRSARDWRLWGSTWRRPSSRALSATIVTTPEADKPPVKAIVDPALLKPAPKPAVAVPVEAPKPPQVTDQQARRLEELFSKEIERYLARQAPPVRDVDVTVSLDRSNLDTLAGMAVGLVAGSGSITLSETTANTTPSSNVAADVRTFELHCRDAKGSHAPSGPCVASLPWPRVVQIKGTVSRGAVLRAEDLVERPVAPDRHDPETHPSGLKDLVGRETTRLLRGEKPSASRMFATWPSCGGANW